MALTFFTTTRVVVSHPIIVGSYNSAASASVPNKKKREVHHGVRKSSLSTWR
jgi:hypothetical protein